MAAPRNPHRGPPANKKINEEVIGFARFALDRRFDKGVVKELLQKRFLLSPRSCETVITKAKRQLRELTGRTVEQHRQDAYQLYDSVLRDNTASVRERLLAQERIDKLLGLEGPIKIEPTGAAAEWVVRMRRPPIPPAGEGGAGAADN